MCVYVWSFMCFDLQKYQNQKLYLQILISDVSCWWREKKSYWNYCTMLHCANKLVHQNLQIYLQKNVGFQRTLNGPLTVTQRRVISWKVGRQNVSFRSLYVLFTSWSCKANRRINLRDMDQCACSHYEEDLFLKTSKKKANSGNTSTSNTSTSFKQPDCGHLMQDNEVFMH